MAHNILVVLTSLFLCYTSTMNATDKPAEAILLKARYTALAGTDIEYGQGAIERNELPHREIEPCVWLIRVPSPGNIATWTDRLNTAVDPKHGSFKVEPSSPDETRRVDSGEVTLQQ